MRCARNNRLARVKQEPCQTNWHETCMIEQIGNAGLCKASGKQDTHKQGTHCKAATTNDEQQRNIIATLITGGTLQLGRVRYPGRGKG